MKTFRRFWRDQSGASAIEYVVIASLVTVGMIAALKSMGASINNMLAPVSANLN